ncbi:MAG TPA: Crp/Fnr family transcriptional regulator, partial [Candidatus Acidoferrum sp.]|nr:Crp/Fnr family transcriptional regulator [Candidatus Acidoferrum sp.]
HLRRRGSQSAAVFAAVLTGTNPREFQAGQTIVSQGEECTDVYYIEKGMVKLTLVSNRGKGAVLGILGQGDFFGEACISGDAVFSTSAIALGPSVIHVIKRKAMIRMVEENPALSANFIAYLLTRNRRIEQDLIDHMFNFSEKRLARVLLLLARIGKDGEVAPILEKIGQDTLAEMVGTTRSRVNFFMNKFRKQGHIHYNGGLKVHDSLESVLHE